MKGLITLAACAAAFALPAVAAASDAHNARALEDTDAAAPAATHDAWSDARPATTSQARMYYRTDRANMFLRADRVSMTERGSKALRAQRTSKALLAHRLLLIW